MKNSLSMICFGRLAVHELVFSQAATIAGASKKVTSMHRLVLRNVDIARILIHNHFYGGS